MTALSSTARSAIAASFVDALNANESTGSLVTQVCDTARKYTKGEAISDDDRADIVTHIAKARGWKKNVIKQRASEVNVVLKAHADLPEAIVAFRTKNGERCQWHDSMKLARRINSGDTVAKAVAFAMRKGQSPKSTPSGRVAGALKAWFKDAPNKQELILKAAALLGIKLGVKLDA